MSVGNLKYARPSDIISALATWSISGGTLSTDPDYGLANLYDGKMSKPTKFIDSPAVNVRLIADLGVATRLDGLALPNSNLPAGTVCRAELNATNSWGTPTVSVNMTLGSNHLDGHRPSPWVDFTTATGYSTSGFRFASLFIPSGAAQPWLGELLLLKQLRSFSRYPRFEGGQAGTYRQFLENLTTEYATQRVLRRKIKQRTLTAQFQLSDADVLDYEALMDDAGGLAQPFFLVADSSIKTDGGLYGRFEESDAQQTRRSDQWFDVNVVTVNFREDSRGLPF